MQPLSLFAVHMQRHCVVMKGVSCAVIAFMARNRCICIMIIGHGGYMYAVKEPERDGENGVYVAADGIECRPGEGVTMCIVCRMTMGCMAMVRRRHR